MEAENQVAPQPLPADKLMKVPLRIRTAGGEVDQTYQDYVMEVDKERVYIKTEQPLPVGTKLHIAIDLPGVKHTVYLRGEVLRININKPSTNEALDPGMGVVFDHVNYDDRKLINSYLDMLESTDVSDEYSTFLTWVHKVSQPMTPKERELVKKDLLKAIYGSGRSRAPVPSAARKKTREDLEIMAGIPLFEELDDFELDELARLAVKEQFAVGQTVFDEGDDGDKMYIIIQGKADVIKSISGNKTQVLVTLGRGEFFGEMSLIDAEPRSAAVMALDDLTLLSISKQDLDHLVTISSSIAAKLYKFFVQILVGRLRDTNEKIKSFMSMAEKLSGG